MVFISLTLLSSSKDARILTMFLVNHTVVRTSLQIYNVLN